MSRIALKKETSYSEFRKKNSLSKNNLHKSMLEIDNSTSIIADDKTSELLSLQNQLQSIVRNRSLSAKPSSKTPNEEQLKLVFNKKTEQKTEDGPLHITKRSSLHNLTTIDTFQKTHRSIQLQPFNDTFEIIEESEIHNEEDAMMGDFDDETNKIVSSKGGAKNEKTTVNRRKNSNQLTQAVKVERKATLNDLDEMQKRLESAKKKTKLDLKDNLKKPIKKSQLIPKPMPQKTQRRIHRTASEMMIVTERAGFKAVQVMNEKDLTPKPVIKKKFTLTDSVKLPLAQKQPSNQLIPTKLVNSEEKQKLLKEFDKIKDSIKNTDICADNMEGIRKMLKTIQGLIN